MRRVSVPVSQATAPQPDWRRATGMPFETRHLGECAKEVCIDVCVTLRICLCVFARM